MYETAAGLRPAQTRMDHFALSDRKRAAQVPTQRIRTHYGVASPWFGGLAMARCAGISIWRMARRK